MSHFFIVGMATNGSHIRQPLLEARQSAGLRLKIK